MKHLVLKNIPAFAWPLLFRVVALGFDWSARTRRSLEQLFRRDRALPVLGLCFASGVSVALVLARIGWTGNFRYAFLIWNLFLAWLPLGFALAADRHAARRPIRKWRFLAYSAAWLLFFPNAPYICTDVIHLAQGLYRHFWVDLTLVLSCAFSGLVVGFVSLYLMQSVVARACGRVAGWLFIGAVAGLTGFGIYLGRFLRFNSWDIVLKPVELLRGIGAWASADPFVHPTAFAFPILFATFMFLAYVMLYALTHLQPIQLAPAGEGQTDLTVQ